MRNKFIKLNSLLLAVTLLFFVACEDRTELTEPGAPASGNADFARFVSIGNSLTAGYQNGSVYQSGQDYSFGTLIAKQIKTTYAQALISDPGIPNRLQIKDLTVVNGEVVGVSLGANPDLGTPLNSDYNQPFNNLGIPGAILYDIADTSDFAAKSVARNNPFFSIVLRSKELGKSILQQALIQSPTLMTLWIGNNDVLGYATSGGTSGTDATGTLPTDKNVFAFLYNQLVTALDATGRNIVVGNIPDVKSIPFFRTVGPQLGVGIQAAQTANPAILGLFYQKTGETVASSFATPATLISGGVLITLTGSTYAGLVGVPSGKYYRDYGLTPGPGIDTTQVFGLHPQNPWPNRFILDANEMAVVDDHTTYFNNTIASLVASKSNFALADMNSFFNQVASNGYTSDGISFTTEFLSGGLFSLDGVHPTSQGSAVLANKFIEVINSKFGASIPYVNVASVPSSIPLAKINPRIKYAPFFLHGSLDNLPF
ncbi:MAG: hypothetical protein K9G57_00700 [Ignavibacteriales bacterium]|nr:hypothetical protein [Ignavibacteriales bacterium]